VARRPNGELKRGRGGKMYGGIEAEEEGREREKTKQH